MIRLLPMTDADFAWLLGEAPAATPAIALCDGGFLPDDVMAGMRRLTARLAAEAPHPVAWLIADEATVIGMTSFIAREADGRYEIGYGVAPAFEGRGATTAAVGELIAIARDLGMAGLTVATGVDNRGSRRVVEKNGFHQTGTAHSEEDGPLIRWAIDLAPSKEQA